MVVSSGTSGTKVRGEGGAPEIERPSLALLALEGQRALFELGLHLQTAPMRRFLPRGDGHPVLVLPGFTASDFSTQPLRRTLRRLGYHAEGWGLGRNLGPSEALIQRMQHKLSVLYAWSGSSKVSIIGWSLGGIYARELARQRPYLVRQVITLGSPFALPPQATNVWRLFERVTGQTVDELVAQQQMTKMREPPPVPSTAIYSRSDGVAHWKACREAESALTDNVEIPGSHCGMGVNPWAIAVVADRLAQKEGQWAPFEPKGSLRWLFSGSLAKRNRNNRGGASRETTPTNFET